MFVCVCTFGFLSAKQPQNNQKQIASKSPQTELTGLHNSVADTLQTNLFVLSTFTRDPRKSKSG